MLKILCDYDKRELELTSVIDNRKSISKYDAVLYADKLGFTWIGNMRNLNINELIYLLGIPEWETYQWTMIVPPGTTHEDRVRYMNEAGVRYDYIAEVCNEPVQILHETNNLEYIKQYGFYVSDEHKNDLVGHSMGLGLYAFDKKLFDEYNIPYSNFNIGVYNGIFFRCIDDTANGDKCGSKYKWKQELLLPFNNNKIMWI